MEQKNEQLKREKDNRGFVDNSQLVEQVNMLRDALEEGSGRFIREKKSLEEGFEKRYNELESQYRDKLAYFKALYQKERDELLQRVEISEIQANIPKALK